MITAELVRGRTLTAWKTIQGDLRQIGATVLDEPVVTDGNWITSRQPSDLEAFSDAVIQALRAHQSASDSEDLSDAPVEAEAGIDTETQRLRREAPASAPDMVRAAAPRNRE